LDIILFGHFFILWTYILVFDWMVGMKSSLIQIKIADSKSVSFHFFTWLLLPLFHKFVQNLNFVIVWNWKLKHSLTVVFHSLWDETVTASRALFLDVYF
jgi:hypothetical protein